MANKYNIGHKFGKLTIIERWTEAPLNKNYNVTFYKCKCDCGKVKTYRSSNVTSGNTISCGCFRSEACRQRERNKNHPTHGIVLSYYKRNAKIRGLAWNLTSEKFTELITAGCEYCGRLPELRIFSGKEIHYNGIDRIDNNVGYESSNVVTCCSQCNWGKNKFSKHEFLDWIERVYKHSIKGGDASVL